MGLEALYLLIPVSIVLALGALAFFVWAIHAGQFDDLETPAMRILFEDEVQKEAVPASGTSEPTLAPFPVPNPVRE